MHIDELMKKGIQYLADLQFDDLCQLKNELNILWQNGQSRVLNLLYDKVVDSLNYEKIK